jgi:2-polyprenyl-3-methyl-5-hydroxy-6-metoxy-1,4-benzoquinol methylase
LAERVRANASERLAGRANAVLRTVRRAKEREITVNEQMDVSKTREQRWAREAQFFDDEAERILPHVEPIPDAEVERYKQPLRPWFSREFKFSVLGDLRGKKILDLGCGDGHNAVLFARLGAASSVGIDISPKAIEVARQSARVSGVHDRCRFVCSPIETASFDDGEFDVVYCQGILHHVIDDLETVMSHVRRWTKPNGLIMFTEPTNFNPVLRRIRSYVPVVTEHTPDERPLEQAEIDRIRPYFSSMKMKHFRLTGRLDRFILQNRNYERSSLFRRFVANVSYSVDHLLLSLPVFNTMGGLSVIYGPPA